MDRFTFVSPKVPHYINDSHDALIAIKHGNLAQQISGVISKHAEAIHVFHAMNSRYPEVRELAIKQSHKDINKYLNKRPLLESIVETLSESLERVTKRYSNKVSTEDIKRLHDGLSHAGHLEWVVKQHIKSPLSDEQLHSLNTSLELFRKHKAKFENRDLSHYSISDLNKAVAPYHKKENLTLIGKGTFEGQAYTVHRINNVEGAREAAKLSKDNPLYQSNNGKAKWCTSADSFHGNNNYKMHTANNPLYVIETNHRKMMTDYNSLYQKRSIQDENNQQVKDSPFIQHIYDKHILHRGLIDSDDSYKAALAGKRQILKSNFALNYTSNNATLIRQAMNSGHNLSEPTHPNHQFINNLISNNNISSDYAAKYKTDDFVKKAIDAMPNNLDDDTVKRIADSMSNETELNHLYDKIGSLNPYGFTKHYNALNDANRTEIAATTSHGLIKHVPMIAAVHPKDAIKIVKNYVGKTDVTGLIVAHSDIINSLPDSVKHQIHAYLGMLSANSDRYGVDLNEAKKRTPELYSTMADTFDDDVSHLDRHSKIALASQLAIRDDHADNIKAFIQSYDPNASVKSLDAFKNAILNDKNIPVDNPQSQLHIRELAKDPIMHQKLFAHLNVVRLMPQIGEQSLYKKAYDSYYRPLTYGEMGYLKHIHHQAKQLFPELAKENESRYGFLKDD